MNVSFCLGLYPVQPRPKQRVDIIQRSNIKSNVNSPPKNLRHGTIKKEVFDGLIAITKTTSGKPGPETNCHHK